MALALLLEVLDATALVLGLDVVFPLLPLLDAGLGRTEELFIISTLELLELGDKGRLF